MISQVSKKRNFSHFLKTKIVATIGPSCSSERILLRMINNGMSVARLNFSHGTHDDHHQVIKKIRALSEKTNTPVAILQDLSGPKIRLANLENPVQLKKNQMIRLSTHPRQEAELHTQFQELPQYVKPGDTILLDDGTIELRVKEIKKEYVLCQVRTPGIAKPRKGINLPDISISIPVFTAKDKNDLIFGLEEDLDMVAMSYVDSAANARSIIDIMKKKSRIIPIIAKIERPTALENIDAIINHFDGIMIARGDLGVEISPEEVPIIQKKLIKMANMQGKMVVTATQMLESMINNPRPTRAEASDVSNAILDGSDAIMLSGETAIGRYPIKAVTMMKKIALITENSKLYPYTPELPKEKIDNTEAIVKSAAEVAKDLKAKCVLVFSQTGNTALLLSKYRPMCPIMAFSPQPKIVSKMAAFWGVSPHLLHFSSDTDEMIRRGEAHVKAEKFVKKGDLVVTVAGVTPMKGATNMLRISKIT